MNDVVLKIIYEINKIKSIKENVVVAIDGRCGSGKSTLANSIKDIFDCNIISMDHFYLPAKIQNKKRETESGGHIDFVKLISEVLINIKSGKDFIVSAFDCRTQIYLPPVDILHKNVTIVEGTYSCHPKLYDYYDLRIFLSIDPGNQKRRILERNGLAGYESFENKWIPLEESYFTDLDIQNCCELFFSL